MTNTVVTLPTLMLAASTDNEDSPRMYRLRKCFAAVQFDASTKGRIVVLDEGTVLRLAGSSAMPKCLEVVYKDQHYNIFQQDLLGPWSDAIKIRRNGTMRAQAKGACV